MLLNQWSFDRNDSFESKVELLLIAILRELKRIK